MRAARPLKTSTIPNGNKRKKTNKKKKKKQAKRMGTHASLPGASIPCTTTTRPSVPHSQEATAVACNLLPPGAALVR